MTAILPTPDRSASLTQVALALAAADVRQAHDQACVEQEVARAATALRQADLEAGRHELLHAADKAVAGGLLAAGFQLTAAACQLQQAQALGAGQEVAATVWQAQATLSHACAKAGDVVAATGQYDQAAKLVHDQAAERLQDTVQESRRQVANADDARRRGLAAMQELVNRAHETARAATRA